MGMNLPPNNQLNCANTLTLEKDGQKLEKFDYFFTIFLFFPLYNTT